MSKRPPESDERTAAQRRVLEALRADPELSAGLDNVVANLARMAADKYRRLFPWEELPDFDAFDAWLTQVGTTLVEFGFYTPDPDQLAQRIAAVGPVGGWRLSDGVTGEPRPATPDEVAQIVATVGQPSASSPGRRPQRRKRAG